jgi:death-on-curing protein
VKHLKWVSRVLAIAIHEETIYEFGGLSGLRDAGLLEGALDRPRNLHAYKPRSTLFQLAASLGVGLAKNHAFNDGNKRTALLTTRVFLYLNGQLLEPAQDDEVMTFVALADGSLGEETFAAWLKANSSPR